MAYSFDRPPVGVTWKLAGKPDLVIRGGAQRADIASKVGDHDPTHDGATCSCVGDGMHEQVAMGHFHAQPFILKAADVGIKNDWSW